MTDEIIIDAHIDKVKIVRNKDESVSFLIYHQSGFIKTFTTEIKDNKVFLQQGGIYVPYNPFEEVKND
jgi:hypothetical protein